MESCLTPEEMERIANSNLEDFNTDDLEDTLTDMFNDEDIEVDIEEKPKKKRRGGIKTKLTGKGNGEPINYMKDWERAELPKSHEFKLFFPKHDIHYKEQLWEVPDRYITYRFELVKLAQEAYNLLKQAGYTEDKCLAAKNGVIRVYNIKTYEDAKIEVKEIGIGVVEDDNGKVVKQLALKESNIRKTVLDYDKTFKKVTKEFLEMLKEVS